jgi:hypothetical protein
MLVAVDRKHLLKLNVQLARAIVQIALGLKKQSLKLLHHTENIRRGHFEAMDEEDNWRGEESARDSDEETRSLSQSLLEAPKVNEESVAFFL